MADILASPYFADVSPRDRSNTDPDALSPADVKTLAEEVEVGIRQDPLRYQRAMNTLGDSATSGNIALLIELPLDDRDLGAAVRIMSYLHHRADQSVEYDDNTEVALAKDLNYRNALEAQRKATSRTVSTGKMSTSQRTHPNATPARDAVRRLRLAFFIDQMVLRQGNLGQSQRAS